MHSDEVSSSGAGLGCRVKSLGLEAGNIPTHYMTPPKHQAWGVSGLRSMLTKT